MPSERRLHPLSFVFHVGGQLKQLVVPALVPVGAAGKVASKATAGGSAELLLKALVNMGYRPAEAERAVKHLGKRVEVEPMGDLLRAALAFLTT